MIGSSRGKIISSNGSPAIQRTVGRLQLTTYFCKRYESSLAIAVPISNPLTVRHIFATKTTSSSQAPTSQNRRLRKCKRRRIWNYKPPVFISMLESDATWCRWTKPDKNMNKPLCQPSKQGNKSSEPFGFPLTSSDSGPAPRNLKKRWFNQLQFRPIRSSPGKARSALFPGDTFFWG